MLQQKRCSGQIGDDETRHTWLLILVARLAYRYTNRKFHVGLPHQTKVYANAKPVKRRQKLAASGGLSEAELPATELPGHCRCNGIRRLELFRSATRADFGPQSDVDLLVEFRPEARIGFIALTRIQRELSVLFGALIGCRVLALNR